MKEKALLRTLRAADLPTPVVAQVLAQARQQPVASRQPAVKNMQRLLRDAGLPKHTVSDLMRTINRAEQQREGVTRAHDWNYVLRPLRAQIQSLASSQKRWGAFPDRAPVYAAYLTLLRKVLGRIEAVRILNTAGKSIPEIAAERGLPMRGLRWAAWVPENVKNAFTLEFEKMYALMEKPGKRIIPFSTRVERRASDVRWDMLLARCIAEREARAHPTAGDQTPMVQALDLAIKAIHSRETNQEAPVNWTHLIPIQDREALERWRNETVDGLRGYDPQAVAHAAMPTWLAQSAERLRLKEARREAARARARQRYHENKKAPLTK